MSMWYTAPKPSEFPKSLALPDNAANELTRVLEATDLHGPGSRQGVCREL